MPSNILITGFASIDSGLNASEVVVRSLMSDLPISLRSAKQLLHFRIINANTHDLRPKLEAFLKEICPATCVFVGQAPGRNNITLERGATNLRFVGPPLHAGEAPPTQEIDASGPELRMSTLAQMDVIIEALHAAVIPAAISNDAGKSLCNQILYEGLRYAEQCAGQPSCGFVHIPALPQQVIERWPDYPFMTLEMIRTAMAIILLELVRDPLSAH